MVQSLSTHSGKNVRDLAWRKPLSSSDTIRLFVLTTNELECFTLFQASTTSPSVAPSLQHEWSVSLPVDSTGVPSQVHALQSLSAHVTARSKGTVEGKVERGTPVAVVFTAKGQLFIVCDPSLSPSPSPSLSTTQLYPVPLSRPVQQIVLGKERITLVYRHSSELSSTSLMTVVQEGERDKESVIETLTIQYFLSLAFYPVPVNKKKREKGRESESKRKGETLRVRESDEIVKGVVSVNDDLLFVSLSQESSQSTVSLSLSTPSLSLSPSPSITLSPSLTPSQSISLSSTTNVNGFKHVLPGMSLSEALHVPVVSLDAGTHGSNGDTSLVTSLMTLSQSAKQGESKSERDTERVRERHRLQCALVGPVDSVEGEREEDAMAVYRRDNDLSLSPLARVSMTESIGCDVLTSLSLSDTTSILVVGSSSDKMVKTYYVDVNNTQKTIVLCDELTLPDQVRLSLYYTVYMTLTLSLSLCYRVSVEVSLSL